MKPRHPAYSLCLAIFAAVAPPHTAAAQGTVADYQRAMAMRERYQGLALNVAESATWIQKSHRFWYRRSVTGGSQFVLVDADSRETRPAFDHARLAATLTDAVKPDRAYTAVTLTSNLHRRISSSRSTPPCNMRSRATCWIRSSPSSST